MRTFDVREVGKPLPNGWTRRQVAPQPTHAHHTPHPAPHWPLSPSPLATVLPHAPKAATRCNRRCATSNPADTSRVACRYARPARARGATGRLGRGLVCPCAPPGAHPQIAQVRDRACGTWRITRVSRGARRRHEAGSGRRKRGRKTACIGHRGEAEDALRVLEFWPGGPASLNEKI